jgi:hypothetical protein
METCQDMFWGALYRCEPQSIDRSAYAVEQQRIWTSGGRAITCPIAVPIVGNVRRSVRDSSE